MNTIQPIINMFNPILHRMSGQNSLQSEPDYSESNESLPMNSGPWTSSKRSEELESQVAEIDKQLRWSVILTLLLSCATVVVFYYGMHFLVVMGLLRIICDSLLPCVWYEVVCASLRVFHFLNLILAITRRRLSNAYVALWIQYVNEMVLTYFIGYNIYVIVQHHYILMTMTNNGFLKRVFLYFGLCVLVVLLLIDMCINLRRSVRCKNLLRKRRELKTEYEMIRRNE